MLQLASDHASAAIRGRVLRAWRAVAEATRTAETALAARNVRTQRAVLRAWRDLGRRGAERAAALQAAALYRRLATLLSAFGAWREGAGVSKLERRACAHARARCLRGHMRAWRGMVVGQQAEDAAVRERAALMSPLLCILQLSLLLAHLTREFLSL